MKNCVLPFVACLVIGEPVLGQIPDAFNPGTNSAVTIYAMAIKPDGQVMIAGHGAGFYTLAQINGDGSYDTNFQSLTFGEVAAIALQPDGKIVVTGYWNGTWITRFNRDGTTDPGFQPAFNNYMGGMSALALQADGKILIGGNFFSYGEGIARLNPDGSLDPNFNASVMFSVYGCCVGALAIQTDEKILIGGLFDRLDNEPRTSLGRINRDGTIDLPFETR